jgi:hypothetical protein
VKDFRRGASREGDHRRFSIARECRAYAPRPGSRGSGVPRTIDATRSRSPLCPDKGLPSIPPQPAAALFESLRISRRDPRARVAHRRPAPSQRHRRRSGGAGVDRRLLARALRRPSWNLPGAWLWRAPESWSASRWSGSAGATKRRQRAVRRGAARIGHVPRSILGRSSKSLSARIRGSAREPEDPLGIARVAVVYLFVAALVWISKPTLLSSRSGFRSS